MRHSVLAVLAGMIVAAGFGTFPALARAAGSPGVPVEVNPTPIALFQSLQRLDLVFEFDYPTFNSTWINVYDKSSAQRFPGVIRYRQGSMTKTLKVQFSARGYHRANHCQFKPLRITFEPGEVAGTIFEGTKDEDIKFVTHCDGNGQVLDTTVAAQNLYEEYTLYRSLQALGLASFKVRLARVTYRTPDGRAMTIAPGFFIEAKKDMAARYGMSHVKDPDMTQASRAIDGSILIPSDLGQLMIQNKDSYIDGSVVGREGGHNVDVLKDKTTGAYMAVVNHDFDYAELVQHHSRNPSGTNDYQWLQTYRATPLQQMPAAKWSLAVNRELTRILTRRSQVLDVVAKSPAADKAKFTKRYARFFDDAYRVLH